MVENLQCIQYSISIPPEKSQKTFGFLAFPGGTEMKHWLKDTLKAFNDFRNKQKKV